MLWIDRVAEEAADALREKISSRKTLVIRDEKTASGRVHVGSLRSAGMHGLISEALTERGVKNTFLYEINDFDPMDGLPVYLDQKKFKPYMGSQLLSIPSPDLSDRQTGEKAPNFAEYFGGEFRKVLEDTGFHPEFYHASELYRSGRMNEAIRMALEKADVIRKIYKEVSGSEKSSDWYPLNVVCENCGKVSMTRVTGYHGDTVSYTCDPKAVDWAEGCGHSGTVSPYDGRAKLPWKVEWAAKFFVLDVDIEGAGKDHFTKGGARQVADAIVKEVYGKEPPFGVMNEFFLVGGKKMSSSKGAGSSAREVADLIPPHILRLALFGKEISRQVNFDPAGDTIPVLYDTYDKLAAAHWEHRADDDARLFTLLHSKEQSEKLEPRFLPRFSLVSFIVQMPHLSLEEEVVRMKGSPLTPGDKKELEERAFYARKWLADYAPEDFKYELAHASVPEGAKTLSDGQKGALREILAYIEEHPNIDGQELHTELHEIRKRTDIDPKQFFSAIYLSFLGKESGPKAGWFLSVIERDFLMARLKEVTH